MQEQFLERFCELEPLNYSFNRLLGLFLHFLLRKILRHKEKRNRLIKEENSRLGWIDQMRVKYDHLLGWTKERLTVPDICEKSTRGVIKTDSYRL